VWDLPLPVTQHSLLVLTLRQQMQPHQPRTQGEALRELLHDADEGLLGFDPISPLKSHLGLEFEALTMIRRGRGTPNRLPNMTPSKRQFHQPPQGIMRSRVGSLLESRSHSEMDGETFRISIG
jgi:hypothetical protein